MGIFLAVNGNMGIYAPKAFCRMYGHQVEPDDTEHWGKEDVQATVARILGDGPDSEGYWDDWQDITDNAVLVNGGVTYRIHQVVGDVWCVPTSWEYDELEDWWKAPTDPTDTDEDIDHLLPEKYL